jgi:hypothetical protein
MLASGCLNANTRAVFLVRPIIPVTRDVRERVDNVVAIANAKNHVGNLAPRAWSHVNGAVLTTHARWCVVR